MNYLSDGNKSILGKRLSSRYLSSDAFTSSTGKTGGRSISRLGSLFSGGKQSKRMYGAGQKFGLFEYKNIVLKIIFVITCMCVIGYTIPFFRYTVHRFFTTSFNKDFLNTYSASDDQSGDMLRASEYYVAPVFGKTDVFVVDTNNRVYPDGSLVYDTQKNTSIGVYTYGSSTKPVITLISDAGQRNVLFVGERNNSRSADMQEVVSGTSTEDGEGVLEDDSEEKNTIALEIQSQEETVDFVSAVFEGFGYGQLRAKVPPQEEVIIGSILYMRTGKGLVPAAIITYIEKDTGSTFTNIYAQLLVAPFELYKVRIEESL